MNSTLSNKTLVAGQSPQQHPPQPTPMRRVRRLTWLDRTALYLGVALIRWGSRPVTVDLSERHAARLAYEVACRERERAMERMLQLHASRGW